jgi:hypothetical protein
MHLVVFLSWIMFYSPSLYIDENITESPIVFIGISTKKDDLELILMGIAECLILNIIFAKVANRRVKLILRIY